MRKYLFLFVSVLVPGIIFSQEHWESIVLAGDTWKYLPATAPPPSGWELSGFDDTSWEAGPGGIGYADDDDATVIGAVNSLYLRRKFQVAETPAIMNLLLDIDYDDAFVAYLNGIEFARSANITDLDPEYNSTLLYDREAVVRSGGNYERHQLNPESLVNGDNILAIQILNNGITSSDLTSIIYLHGFLNGSDLVYNPTPDWFQPPVNLSESNLPLIKIDTYGQNIEDDPRIIAHMGVINNYPGQMNSIDDAFTDYDGRISIEIRGQSSQMFPKKSFALETQDATGGNLNISLLGMPPENDWILYAPYSDKSMLRNVTTFKLAEKLGHYCSRTSYCELYINDEYQGVYVLMEKIKQDDNRVDISKLWSNEISGDDMTGGYIFKVDKVDGDYSEGFSGWKSVPEPSYPEAMDIIYQYFYPDPDSLAPEQRQYLKEYVNEAEEVLISEFFADPDIGYNSYLNTGSFVDFLIINEISKEVDKYRYSNYFHKKKESKGGEIFAGPIWDFNLGFGNVDYWQEGLYTSGWLYEDVHSYDWSIIFWWKRLMEDNFFRDLTYSRWSDLREDEFSDQNIQLILDSLTSLLSEPQQRNYEKWQILGSYVWPNYDWENNKYQDEVDYFSDWLFDRLHWMDSNMYGNQLKPAITISDYDCDSDPNIRCVKIDLSDAYFNHTRLKKKFFVIDDGIVSAEPFEVVSLGASQAILSIDLNQISGGNEIKIIIDPEITTWFDTIESNSIKLDSGNTEIIDPPFVEIFSNLNVIRVNCNDPDMLGENIRIYNSSGTLCGIYKLEKTYLNVINTGLHTGIYFIRMQGENELYTKKILLTK